MKTLNETLMGLSDRMIVDEPVTERMIRRRDREAETLVVQGRGEPVFAPLDDVVFLLPARQVRRLIAARRAGLRLPLASDVETTGLTVSVWIDDEPVARSNPAVWRVRWQVDGSDAQRSAVAEAVHAYMGRL